MASENADRVDLELVESYPTAIRLLWLAAGLFAIVMPLWEFKPWLWRLTWTMPFFAVIVIGAMLVGLVFVAGAVAGPSRHCRFAAGRLRIDSRSWLGRSSEILTGADIASTTIVTNVWDSGPDTYAVALVLKNGRRLETPDRATRSAALALEAEIHRLMGIDRA